MYLSGSVAPWVISEVQCLKTSYIFEWLGSSEVRQWTTKPPSHSSIMLLQFDCQATQVILLQEPPCILYYNSPWSCMCYVKKEALDCFQFQGLKTEITFWRVKF